MSAASEINRQVALIKDEINQQKKEKAAILNAKRDDLHLRYHRILGVSLKPTLSMGAIYTAVSQKLLLLDKILNSQLTFFAISISNQTRRMAQAEAGELTLEIANSETGLMAIVDAANNDIQEADRRLDAIQGIFEKLAASLPFSLDIVGIVARYGV